MRIIFLGPPGVGKGMIGQRIHYDIISTGEILREEAKKDTPEAQALKKSNAAGVFAPDKLVISLVKEEIEGKDDFALDGFPRTIKQAIALDKIMNVDKVIYLTAPKTVLMKRILGRVIGEDGTVYHLENHPPPKEAKIIHRSDDSKEVIKKRLEIYKKKTHPLVDFYTTQDKLVKINANRPFEEVVKDVLKIISDK